MLNRRTDNDLVAVGADTDAVQRQVPGIGKGQLAQLGNSQAVVLCRFRQLLKGSNAAGRGLPAGQGFVDRNDSFQVGRIGRHQVERIAIEHIVGADFEFRQSVEEVELSQGQFLDAVEKNSSANQHRIEVADVAPPTSGGAELSSWLAYHTLD